MYGLGTRGVTEILGVCVHGLGTRGVTECVCMDWELEV